VLRRLDPSVAGVRSEPGSCGTGSWILAPDALGALVEVGDRLGASAASVGLLVGSGSIVGVSDPEGTEVSPPTGAVAEGDGVGSILVAVAAVGVLALVEVAVATGSVAWSVGTSVGVAEGTGAGVSEGSTGGIVGVSVGGRIVGPAVDGTVGTPDGVSVGMVWFR
jgi:hypothetical protein